MRKIIKIAAGAVLLGISAFYLLGLCLVMKDVRKDAVYHVNYYLQPEYLGCEYLGGSAQIDGNVEWAEEGYEFYRLDFQLKNLSSVFYSGGFDYLIVIKGESYSEVGRIFAFPGQDPEEIYTGIYSTVSPVLPGKTQMDLTYYVEVQEGVAELSLMYYPSWDKDRTPLGTIPLEVKNF